ECIFSPTNKNFKNTILTKIAETDLYDDIAWFINNEKHYSEKGLPYKRGYILHGPPGTGKSSIIKAIANEYRMDIFNIDLEIIKTGNHLTKLMTDINYRVKNRKYILAIEDIDRSPLLNTNQNIYYSDNHNDKLNICTFINF